MIAIRNLRILSPMGIKLAKKIVFILKNARYSPISMTLITQKASAKAEAGPRVPKTRRLY